jgi:hypothetical protein
MGVQMVLDLSVSLGALLNAAAIVVGFAIAFTRIGGRIDLLAQRLGSVEDTLKADRDKSERIAVIETLQATHAQMIASAQTEITDMKRGRGFVIGPREFSGDHV